MQLGNFVTMRSFATGLLSLGCQLLSKAVLGRPSPAPHRVARAGPHVLLALFHHGPLRAQTSPLASMTGCAGPILSQSSVWAAQRRRTSPGAHVWAGTGMPLTPLLLAQFKNGDVPPVARRLLSPQPKSAPARLSAARARPRRALGTGVPNEHLLSTN